MDSTLKSQSLFNRHILCAALLLLIGISMFFWSSASAKAQDRGWRDPTQPPGDLSADSVGSLRNGGLTTILFSPQRKLAIINDQIARAGDKVGNLEIIAIMPDSVLVRDQNSPDQEFILTLAPHNVKVQAGTKGMVAVK